MPAKAISLEHAKSDKLFYFVANVCIYRESDGRCLILKRSMHEKVHPGKYCMPGGKLEWKDLDITKPTRMNGEVFDFEGTLEKLLIREAKEEAGVTISSQLTYMNSIAFIRPDGVPVMMLKFAAAYESGEVTLEPDAFDSYAWVNAEESKQYDCIMGIPNEIAQVTRMINH